MEGELEGYAFTFLSNVVAITEDSSSVETEALCWFPLVEFEGFRPYAHVGRILTSVFHFFSALYVVVGISRC